MQMEKQNQTLIVYLDGELDHCSAQSIRRLLDGCIKDSDVKNMVLDMQELNFMDSSGIGVILGRYRQIKDKGGRMMVRNMNRQVERVFRLSGMNQIIETV